jgi:hypothetical protein
VLIRPALECRERLGVEAARRVDLREQSHGRAQSLARRLDLAEDDRVRADQIQQERGPSVQLGPVLARSQLGREVQHGP